MRNAAPMHRDRSKISYKEMVAVILIYVCVMGFLFHVQFASGFNLLTGDRYDGIIENSLLEHWYNVFRGKSHWNTVGYFFPYTNTMGYNDGYFLYGVISSLFRASGFDIFLSADLVNASLKTIGFFTFYYLCRQCIGLKPFFAITGTVVFSLANNLIPQSGHAQLLSIALSPLLAILLYRYVTLLIKQENPKRTIIYGSAAGVLLGAWLLTTYYMAWFFIFFTLIIFAIILSVLLCEKLRNKKCQFKFSFNIYEIVIPAIVTIISFLPFLIVYLQAAKATGMHSFDDVFNYTPHLSNIINPGSNNLLYGKLSDYIFSTFYPELDRGGEFLIGFPPVILLMSLCALFYFWKKSTFTISSILMRSISLALFISLILMIKFGNHTLWKLVWEFIPGAKGMRVTSRYALFLIFPMTIVVMSFLSELSKTKLEGFIFLLACFLMLEQVNLSTSQHLNRQDQLSFIRQAGLPPASCRSFFVSGQRTMEYLRHDKRIDDNLYPHNVDAMLLSEVFALRTLNGFSTFNPPDWDFNLSPVETYMSRVAYYVHKHNMHENLCEYDLFSSRWRSHNNERPIGLAPITSNELILKELNPPELSADKMTWHIGIQLTNLSSTPLGRETIYPINLGVRGLKSDGSVLYRDLFRATVDTLNANGGQLTVNIELPVTLFKTDEIDILPVQEGIAWLDKIGIKPLNFKRP